MHAHSNSWWALACSSFQLQLPRHPAVLLCLHGHPYITGKHFVLKNRAPFMLGRKKMVKEVGSENSFSSFHQKEILCEESPSGLCEAVKWPFLTLTIQVSRRRSANKILPSSESEPENTCLCFPALLQVAAQGSTLIPVGPSSTH